MSTTLAVLIMGLLAGLAVGVQSPLASIITNRLGTMESVFIIHLGGALVAAVVLAFQRGGNLTQWRSVPWYALAGGALGLMVIAAVGFTIPRVGAVTTVFLIVAGQIIAGVLIDHYGLLETTVQHLDAQRLVGIGVLFAGIWLILR